MTTLAEQPDLHSCFCEPHQQISEGENGHHKTGDTSEALSFHEGVRRPMPVMRMIIDTEYTTPIVAFHRCRMRPPPNARGTRRPLAP